MSYLMIIVVNVAQVISTLLNVYMWVVIISALITWVNPDPYNPIVRFLRNATEPLFWRIRRWLPFVVVGGFDLSPILVILAVQILRAVIGQLVFDLAMRAPMMGSLSTFIAG